MLNCKFKNAFTLVELLVATIISSVVLIAIFAITSEILDEAVFTNKSVTSYSSLYDIEKKILKYKNIYSTGTILIDNASGVGSDVFIFLNSDNSEALLMGVVNNYSRRLVPDTQYSIYGNNSLGFREVIGTGAINDMLVDPSIVYGTGIKFQVDKIYDDFVLRDMQMISYNSGKIKEVNFNVNLFFNKNLEGENWQYLPEDRLVDFTLDF
ncbi:hypothetical protein CSB07_00350 [Candidatus Gracilibacteria bacterium]|nr:MAG: hypothetical protein CSB07_00350 [Candidatus Gracilibacteria bacterium]PIE85127.1 MAG: hypothetical protein CSA08_03720 [Candidatus Gracilibacteria bacterium]